MFCLSTLVKVWTEYSNEDNLKLMLELKASNNCPSLSPYIFIFLMSFLLILILVIKYNQGVNLRTSVLGLNTELCNLLLISEAISVSFP